jgi:hypothetical protein
MEELAEKSQIEMLTESLNEEQKKVHNLESQVFNLGKVIPLSKFLATSLSSVSICN